MAGSAGVDWKGVGKQESDGGRARIPGVRKAAILIMAVGEELARNLIQSLSEGDVQRIADEISNIGEVSDEQLDEVMSEFHGRVQSQGYMLRGGHDYAARLLTEAFGPARADQLLAQANTVRERTTGDLAMLQKMEPQQLSKFLENEHPQTVALVLAHLDSKRGSGVLMHLGSQMRVEAVRRLAEMRQFSPEMAQKVALVLHRRMDSLGSTGRKNYAGYKAVADLLNRMDQTICSGILEEIEKKEPKTATDIRSLMFTFEDLLTVPQQGIRELVSAADKKMLAMSLKGGKENIRAHIFKAMSSRAAEMMRDDMEAMGPVRSKDVNAAQLELLALAQRLEAEGKMVLRMEVDNDVTV
jgi:flagellar motor switch protein FliG